MSNDYERGDWADDLAAKIIKADADPSSIEIASHLRREHERGFTEAIERAVRWHHEEARKIWDAWENSNLMAHAHTPSARFHENAAAAIRALSPDEDTVRVPREGLRRLRNALADLKYVARNQACMYRPDDQPETAQINAENIDHTFHCCDWNEVYEICCIAEGEADPHFERVRELEKLQEAHRARAMIAEVK